MEARSKRKVQLGIVTSTKMKDTISVMVERRLAHPVYGKYYKQTKKFLVHAPSGNCQVGDRVRIAECRPISKRKRWRLVEIVEKKV